MGKKKDKKVKPKDELEDELDDLENELDTDSDEEETEDLEFDDLDEDSEEEEEPPKKKGKKKDKKKKEEEEVEEEDEEEEPPKKKGKKKKEVEEDPEKEEDESGTISIDDVVIPKKMVRDIDIDDESISELVKSIKIDGMIIPIIVDEDGVLVAGYRRYLAHKKLKRDEIACITYDVNEAKRFKIALIENIQREQLSIEEEANCYLVMMENKKKYPSQAALAKDLGISESKITRAMQAIGKAKTYKKEKTEKPAKKKACGFDKNSLPDGVATRIFKDRLVITFTIPFQSKKHFQKFDINEEIGELMTAIDVEEFKKEMAILRKEL